MVMAGLVAVLLGAYVATSVVVVRHAVFKASEGETAARQHGGVPQVLVAPRREERVTPPPTTRARATPQPTLTTTTTTTSTTTDAKTPLQIYFEKHQTIPVVVLCYNRPAEVAATLDSLLKARWAKTSHVLVAQDGNDESVAREASSRGLRLEQSGGNAWVGANGGARIARHYAFALDKAFATFPDAPAVVVLEDDMRLSPDFIEFFAAVGPVVEKDKTLWCVSAWNDNGFAGVARDPFNLRRTVLFPGLGWLLFRTRWEEDLKPRWPGDQWDWYVRGMFIRKDLECAYPEVPRAFHAGRVGTFMDPQTHVEYFDRIVHNTDSNVRWFSDPRAEAALQRLVLKAYDDALRADVARAKHVTQPETFQEDVRRASPDAVFVVWYEASVDPRFEARVRTFTSFFRVWHQLMRASHESVLDVRFGDAGVRVLLVNVVQPQAISSTWFTPYSHRSFLVEMKPNSVPVFDPEEFVRRAGGRTL